MVTIMINKKVHHYVHMVEFMHKDVLWWVQWQFRVSPVASLTPFIIIIITFPQYVYKFYVWIWILNFILWFLGFYVGILWKLQILIIIVLKKTPSEWKNPSPKSNLIEYVLTMIDVSILLHSKININGKLGSVYYYGNDYFL